MYHSLRVGDTYWKPGQLKNHARMKSNMKYVFMSLAIAMTCFSFAQNNDHNGGGFPLTSYVVKSTDDIDALEKSLPEGTVIINRHHPFHAIEILNEKYQQEELIRLLSENPQISFFERVQFDQAGNPIIPTGFFMVKSKRDFATAAIAFCEDKGCIRKNELSKLSWTVFELPKNLSFKEFESFAKPTGLFEMIMQDEIVLCEEHISDDTFWSSCWYVSQSTDKDIDADLAWTNMPTGNTTGHVAVIDGHGFDVTHPDLANNIAGSYNAVNQTTNVTPTTAYEKHATACAGIPGAIYNNALGVPGLGYNKIKILAIQIGYNAQASGTFYTSATIQADAINFAMTNASTCAISMSFGGTTYQTSFYNAITSARTTARNGKGIPVFASCGNSGITGWVNYPASYSGVIAVASTTSLDFRSSFSNYGQGTTLAAPGTAITTTDVAGTNGYSTTDYTNFSGTSAACPVAASVGAMMIIANSNLTEVQVKTLMAQSCEKVGGYSYGASTTDTYSTWSNELGYGRVNMNNAVLAAIAATPINPDISISGYSVNDNTVTAGQAVTITASQVTSMPSQIAVNPTLECRWSTDQVWSATDVLIGNSTSALGNGITSEIETFNYTIPAGTGMRYILIKCDAGSIVTESNETNNMVVIPVTVSSTTATPDLTIASMSISDLTPNVGQTVLLSCSQTITGATSTSAVTMEYRYSTDGTWSSDDLVLGTDVSNIGVSPSSETESITFIIPGGTGNRFILAKADSPDQMTESNETNNVFALPVVVSAATVNPDITIGGLTSTATTVVVAQTVTVSCQQIISNPPTSVIQVNLEYRWSTDLIFDTSDLLLGNTTSSLGGSSTSEAESITFTIPEGTGTRYLLVKADANNTVTETNESNVYSIMFNVSLPSSLPDVFIDAFTVSLSTVTPGQQITVACFQNISDPAFTATNVFMEYRWATGTTYSTSYSIIGIDYSSIGGGDADDDETLTFTVPAGTGQRYVMIKCDSNNGVNESNENNNVYTIPVLVVAAALPVPSSSNSNSKLATFDTLAPDAFEENNNDHENAIELSCFPNPAHSILNITLQHTENEITYYEIIDMTGHVAQQGKVMMGIHSGVIEVQDLSSGTYLLHVTNGSFSGNIRFIISK